MTKNECRDYAESFWEDLTSTLWVEGFLEHIPMVFIDAGQDEKKPSAYGVTHYHTNTRTGIASIYPVVYLSRNRDEEDTKRTIRHEAIHYYLGIEYYCHGDDSALFWLICGIFDAGAYEPLNSRNYEIYTLAKPFFDEILCLYKTMTDKSIALNISLMMTAVDACEHSTDKTVNSLKATLSVCLDAAKMHIK